MHKEFCGLGICTSYAGIKPKHWHKRLQNLAYINGTVVVGNELEVQKEKIVGTVA